MTIDSQPRETRIQPMEVDPGKSAVRPWFILGAVLFTLLSLFATYVTLVPRGEPELTYEQKLCIGLSDMECFERLELERRRQEFLETETGKNLLKATDR
jgi:hypothetical protein